MISISDTYKQKIINELISNKLEILFPDGEFETITETNIESESMNLKQSICDEDSLRFGGCIASQFKISLINTTDRIFDSKLAGCWIAVRLTQSFPSGNPLFCGNVYPEYSLYPGETVTSKVWYVFNGVIDSSDIDKNDRNKITIVAYDVISQLYSVDVTNVLQNAWINKQGTTVGTIITAVADKIKSLCNNSVGTGFASSRILNEIINQAENLTVKNMRIYNDVWFNDAEKLNYGQMIAYIAEMLGTFIFVKPASSRGGDVSFVQLEDDAAKSEIYSFYESLYTYEKKVSPYTSVQFSVGGTNRIAKIRTYDFALTTSHVIYDMTNNIFVWQENDNAGGGYTHKFENLFSGATGARLNNLPYIPIEATLDGRLWVEVGDMICIKTYVTDADGNYIFNTDGTAKTENVKSYVLSRELTGIQALTDNIIAKGV